MRRATSTAAFGFPAFVLGACLTVVSPASASPLTVTLNTRLTGTCTPSSDEYLCSPSSGSALFALTYDPDDLIIETLPDGTATIRTAGQLTFTTSLPGLADPWGGTITHRSTVGGVFDAGTARLVVSISDHDSGRACLAIGPGCGHAWITSLFLSSEVTGLPLGTPTADDFARLLTARGTLVEYESSAYNIPDRRADLEWVPGSALYTAIVPEPATGLLVLAAAGLGARRRWRRR